MIATVLAMMRRKHVLKQLDDVVAFGAGYQVQQELQGGVLPTQGQACFQH